MATATSERRGAQANEQGEGPIARMIEEQTAKLPSDAFLWAACGSARKRKQCSSDNGFRHFSSWASTTNWSNFMVPNDWDKVSRRSIDFTWEQP
jgi:hypothetical protein